MGRFYNLFAIGEGGQCLLWVMGGGPRHAHTLPSALAVLRLSANSNFVAACAGRLEVSTMLRSEN